MWKNKKREQTEHPERGTGCSIRKQGMLLACALLGILLCGPLSGCGQEKVAEAEASEKKSEAIEQENSRCRRTDFTYRSDIDQPGRFGE